MAMQSTQATHALLAVQAKLAGMASLGRLVADGCVVRHGPPKDSGPAPSAGSGQALRQAQDRLTTNRVGPTIGSVAWVNGVAGCAESAVCRWVPAEDAGMTGSSGALSAGGCGQNGGGAGAWWWCEELFWVSGMTAAEFIDKWRKVTQTEKAVSQSHFNDLCAVLGERTPVEADPEGDEYCFERGAAEGQWGRRVGGCVEAWVHFAWEYKSQGKDLDAAFQQLRQYALALENPPLLIVSDMRRLPDSHELDEQRQHGPRVHAVRARRPGHAQAAEVGVQRAGAAAAGADAAGADGAGGGHLCRTGAGDCGRAGTTHRSWRTSSTDWSSACSRKTWGCCRTRCSGECWTRRACGPSGLPGWPAACLGP